MTRAATHADDDFGSMSLHALFRSEAEGQVQVLTEGLLALDRDATNLAAIEPLMRAAHSLKGAARIVNLTQIERLSHGMEDCFVAAQKGKLQLNKNRIDRLLAGVDLIGQVAALSEDAAPGWLVTHQQQIAHLVDSMAEVADPNRLVADESALALMAPFDRAPTSVAPLAPSRAERDPQQVLKIDARSFDHLLALASESRVAAHAMRPHLQAMDGFKRRQYEMFSELEQLGEVLMTVETDASVKEKFLDIRNKTGPLKQFMVERLAAFEAYESRLLRISQEMLDEVLVLRMRPFRDGVQAFPRMVRDLAHSLGKQVRLVILGEDTLVDRDILAKMESPLNHLLRNALDHGLEPPEQRLAMGKPAQGTLTLEARHSAGMLVIQVSDDGRGVDLEKIRRAVVARQMASAPMAAAMSGTELLDFLLLPAFSLKETVSEVSGRGVGLDVVGATVRQLHGTVSLATEPGQGFRTHITLALSQSVVRVVVVTIAGDAYALPIAKVQRLLKTPRSSLHTLKNTQFFTLDNEHVGLISAAELLDLGESRPLTDMLSLVVIGSGHRRYGLVVDAICGEQSLPVQPIEAIFGKIRDVSAAALLDDGSPVLILDVPGLLVSIEKLASEGLVQRLQNDSSQASAKAKRVLVVDDSLTVREMERKLLQARGFDVTVAVDGMDGWNAVRSGEYDLVITDVDMPRMDGIELVTLIKQDSRLHKLPVMIVSYKDRPEDRARGISAGADYYLTKGSFHDETLLDAVGDLIGENDA